MWNAQNVSGRAATRGPRASSVGCAVTRATRRPIGSWELWEASASSAHCARTQASRNVSVSIAQASGVARVCVCCGYRETPQVLQTHPDVGPLI